MAIQTNIELYAGDDRILDITVMNDAGVVVPLSSVSEISWLLRESYDGTTNLIEKSLGTGEGQPGGIAITNSGGGIYSVTLLPSDTEDLAGVYYWESIITDDADGIYTAAYGYASVKGKGVARGSYCTLEEAMALMAEMDITERTRPSLATAQIIVETIARDIDGVLMGRGQRLPITDTNALAWLKSVNQYGACAAIIRSRKLTARGVGGDDGSAAYFEEKYRAALTQLTNPDFDLLGAVSTTETIFVWGGTPLSTDDTANDPFWTRETYF